MGQFIAKTITNAVNQLKNNKKEDLSTVFNLIAQDINSFYNIKNGQNSKLYKKQSTEYSNEVITEVLVKNARSLTSNQRKILSQIDKEKMKVVLLKNSQRGLLK